MHGLVQIIIDYVCSYLYSKGILPDTDTLGAALALASLIKIDPIVSIEPFIFMLRLSLAAPGILNFRTYFPVEPFTLTRITCCFSWDLLWFHSYLTLSYKGLPIDPFVFYLVLPCCVKPLLTKQMSCNVSWNRWCVLDMAFHGTPGVCTRSRETWQWLLCHGTFHVYHCFPTENCFPLNPPFVS